MVFCGSHCATDIARERFSVFSVPFELEGFVAGAFPLSSDSPFGSLCSDDMVSFELDVLFVLDVWPSVATFPRVPFSNAATPPLAGVYPDDVVPFLSELLFAPKDLSHVVPFPPVSFADPTKTPIECVYSDDVLSF